MNTVQKVIAIDGPAGSGKSSIAKQIASKLSITYIDTGSMFRSIGVYQKQNKIDDIASVIDSIEMKYIGEEDNLIHINGINMTSLIRTPEASQLASEVSQIPEVRNLLAKVQRDLVQTTYAVMEGRDIGTVIFPNAFVKIFLTASVDERAKRRSIELQKSGESIDINEVKKQIIERDQKDSQREIAPLKKADDAIEIDTTHMNMDEVIAKIIDIFESKKAII